MNYSENVLLSFNETGESQLARMLREQKPTEISEPEFLKMLPKEKVYNYFIRLGTDEDGVEIFMHKATKELIHCFGQMMIFKNVIPTDHLQELDQA